MLIEAAAQIGGRCITDTSTFGVPYDRGAHWIHMAELNPLAKLARGTGLEVYPAPPGQRLRIGGAEDSRLVARRLADNRRVICAAPSYLRRHGRPRSPA